jgi:hypothetical protein
MTYYGDKFTLLYMGDIRTSQEIYIWTSTASYGERFTLLNVEYVHTAQEILWASTASCGYSFTYLHAYHVCTSKETRPVMGIAVLFYMYTMFVPNRKHTMGLHCMLRR